MFCVLLLLVAVQINQSKPECGRQTLVELLIRPVQRLPSVGLLLNGNPALPQSTHTHAHTRTDTDIMSPKSRHFCVPLVSSCTFYTKPVR